MITLTFLDKNVSDKVYELAREKTTVGRAASNHIVLQDKSVSAHHCEILVWGNEVIVRDLDSANGTFVNEARLNKQSGANSGQILRFGSVKARVEIKPEDLTDDETELTAIYAHNRAVRELQREKERDAEEAVMMLGRDDTSVDSVENTTVLLNSKPPSQPATCPPARESTEPPAKKKDRSNSLSRRALALIGLGFVLWMALAYIL